MGFRLQTLWLPCGVWEMKFLLCSLSCPPIVLLWAPHRLLCAYIIQGSAKDLKGIYMHIWGLLLSDFLFSEVFPLVFSYSRGFKLCLPTPQANTTIMFCRSFRCPVPCRLPSWEKLFKHDACPLGFLLSRIK